jgi:hypothetical protein
VIIAAALCPAPPLLARELTGAGAVLPELREACLLAAAGLVAAEPDLIAIVGVSEQTRRWPGSARPNLAAYAPGPWLGGGDGPAAPGQDGPADLPLPLGLGSRLLDQAGYRGPRWLQSVGQDEPAGRCAALGAELAAGRGRGALLVMADGGARRGLKAPGYLDERCAPFDAGVQDAIRAADLPALLELDASLARELMATGRPAWQVLAGAMDGDRPACVIGYSGDPFGVAYLVALLRSEHG